MLKRNLQLFALNIGVIFLTVCLAASALTVLQFLNITFYFVLIYMVLTLATYTVKGGFYDGVAFGLRRFRSKISKDGDPLEDWREKAAPSARISMPFYKAVRFQTIALLLLLLILFLIYYK
ncbi:hypothetical protein GCM10007063_01420 [Lentibacillus kapialis]|uniref:DUF3899 domain-containing protein n=1 Tax=Lentibacillus kapialis TaxID=340214 RepID=A0A917USQ0_9BACI|nr:DUF3899 domain-containing protein [Lentibacillus kapialis]GGJ82629.1 hypothetical protein GCM10007063_01420 [Lentibacillus kapialis]